MSRQISNVNITTDTWENLITKENDLLYSLSTEIITANATYANTGNTSVPRNAQLYGVFSSNTISITDNLRGGNVTSSGNLSITSNVSITGATLTNSANSLHSNTSYFTSNVSITGSQITTTSNTSITSSNVQIISNNVVMKSNSTITALNLFGNSTVTTVTIGGNTLTVSSNVIITGTNHTIAGNVNFDTGTLFVNASGNVVGIGTTSPAEKLDVRGTIRQQNATDGVSGVFLYDALSNKRGTLYNANTNHVTLQSENGVSKLALVSVSGSVNILSNNQEALIVAANGNVGIGTTTPTTKLDANGYIRGTEILLLNGGASSPSLGTTPSWYSPASGVAALSTNASERMRIDSSGNVGISNTSPTSKLQITSSSNRILNLDMTQNGAGNSAAIFFSLRDSTNAVQDYAAIYSTIEDNTNGSEDGQLSIHTVTNGTLSEKIKITSNSEVVFSNDYTIQYISNNNVGSGSTPIVYSFPKGSYRSAKITAFISNNGNNQMSELILVHDNTTPYTTMYATVASPPSGDNNSPLGTFFAQINTTSNYVELLLNQVVANSQVKIVSHLMK